MTETQRWLLKATANLSWLRFELGHIAPQGAGCHESPRCNLKSQPGLNCAGLSYKNRSLTPACIALVVHEGAPAPDIAGAKQTCQHPECSKATAGLCCLAEHCIDYSNSIHTQVQLAHLWQAAAAAPHGAGALHHGHRDLYVLQSMPWVVIQQPSIATAQQALFAGDPAHSIACRSACACMQHTLSWRAGSHHRCQSPARPARLPC